MPHNEECREIFRRLMKDEAKVKNAEARKAEFEEKMRRKVERRSKRKEGRESEKGEMAEGGNEEDDGSSGGKVDDQMDGDDGENLLGSEEEKKVHREFVKEEKRRVERQWKEEKKRRVEENRKTQMGWSRPKVEWSELREGAEEVEVPEGQMRAERIKKRPPEGVGGEEEEEQARTKFAGDEAVVGEESESEAKKRRLGQMDIMRLECLVNKWVGEVECRVVEEEEWEEAMQGAWDDVHEGHSLDPEKVKEGRKEEITFMEGRGIWTVRPTKECWESTGAKPISVRWVDTDKNWMAEGDWEPLVRSD